MRKLWSVVTAAAVLAGVVFVPTSTSASSDQPAGSQTWLLASPSDLRLPPPPGDADTRAELAELASLAESRDGAALDRIRYWDAGSPSYRWTQRAVKYAQGHGVAGNRAFRMMALVNVAISDATVAAFDSKLAYSRPRPASSVAAISTPTSPAYPDEHAAAAGAASTVLAYLFPSDADLFASWAAEAANSRVEGGVAYPSDSSAGLTLGRQVGDLAVAWAQADGSDAKWTGSVPTEPGQWTGTNPVEPLAGTWKPWALESGREFRPAAPPAVDSEQLARELAEVKNYKRSNLTNLLASFWEFYGGRAAFEYWDDAAGKLIFEHRLQDDPVRAAQVYAQVHVASHDAAIACWDAKYTYWAARPAMLDPTITTQFVTPNHPSYPSAHSCISGAIGTVLTRQFPSEAAALQAILDQVGEARIMGGIHVRSDIDAGATLGKRVGEVVAARGT